MNYLLICAMLALSSHYIHGMHKEDRGKDNGDKRDFNYIPPGTPKSQGVRLPGEIYAQALAAMPIVCTDVILLRLNKDGQLEYFMVKRTNRPAHGFWWFPGGRMDSGEEILDAAERKCRAEGNLGAASFAYVDIYRTRFPDSEWLHPATGERLITDSFNNVVIAFYDPQTEQTGRYEDAEEIQWVDFEARPSSLPMPPQEERQGVDVAYLDRAFDDAHRILDPLIANGSIEQVIEETLRERREHRQALSALQVSSSNPSRSQQSPLIGTDTLYVAVANFEENTVSVYNAPESAIAAQETPQRRGAGEDPLQFSFDDDELPALSIDHNPPFAHPRPEGTSADASQSPHLLPRPSSPLTVVDGSGRQLPSPRQRSLRQSTASAHMPTSPRNAQESDEENEVEEVLTPINSTQESPPRASSRIRDELSAQLGELRIQEYLQDPKVN